MPYIRMQIKDFEGLKKKLDDMKEAPHKVLENIMSDAKKRIPPWVATEVSKQYGIKKAEVGNGSTSKVQVKGSSISDLVIIYSGRVLTPTHLGMTPKAPGVNAYTLRATIIKGQKSTLGKVKKLTKRQRIDLGRNFHSEGARTSGHSPIMLMGTGNKQLAGTSYIPFQRKSPNRKDVKVIKTLSVPQMVGSDRAKPEITKAINDGLEKRLEHHMSRAMGK